MFNYLVIGFEEDRFWKFEALMVPIFLLYGDSEILFGQLVTNNAIKKKPMGMVSEIEMPGRYCI